MMWMGWQVRRVAWRMDGWTGGFAERREEALGLLGGVLCGVVDLALEEEDVRLGGCDEE